VLIDDLAGFRVAIQRGFAATGTMGILTMAARTNLVDLGDAFERLRSANFRYPPKLMATKLHEVEMRKQQ
jgi:predicted nucleic acid-binding protein